MAVALVVRVAALARRFVDVVVAVVEAGDDRWESRRKPSNRMTVKIDGVGMSAVFGEGRIADRGLLDWCMCLILEGCRMWIEDDGRSGRVGEPV